MAEMPSECATTVSSTCPVLAENMYTLLSHDPHSTILSSGDTSQHESANLPDTLRNGVTSLVEDIFSELSLLVVNTTEPSPERTMLVTSPLCNRLADLCFQPHDTDRLYFVRSLDFHFHSLRALPDRVLPRKRAETPSIVIGKHCQEVFEQMTLYWCQLL